MQKILTAFRLTEKQREALKEIGGGSMLFGLIRLLDFWEQKKNG